MIDNSIVQQIQTLAKLEANNINERFKQSQEIAEAHILMSILSFEDFLTKSEGRFILGMNIKYRLFIVELLNNIHSAHRDFALSIILFHNLLHTKGPLS